MTLPSRLRLARECSFVPPAADGAMQRANCRAGHARLAGGRGLPCPETAGPRPSSKRHESEVRK
eukprot:4683178-Pyramimonas_sp.AAC.1